MDKRITLTGSSALKTLAMAIICLFLSSQSSWANDKQIRVFFGLSCPAGRGVSLEEWQKWEHTVLAKKLPGFNVVDSTGYYNGRAERSKVVTIIVFEEDQKTEQVIRTIARDYADKFGQDSVLMVTTDATAVFIRPGQ